MNDAVRMHKKLAMGQSTDTGGKSGRGSAVPPYARGGRIKSPKTPVQGLVNGPEVPVTAGGFGAHAGQKPGKKVGRIGSFKRGGLTGLRGC